MLRDLHIGWYLLAKKTSEIELLRERAKEYKDYDEIKRELEIMKVDGFVSSVP